MGTTYYSLGRKLYQRAPSTAKIVISANGKNAVREAIVSLIQDQQNGGYLEDDAISPLSQGVRIPDCFSYIVQSFLFLQNPINYCVLIHERLQLAALRRSAPN